MKTIINKDEYERLNKKQNTYEIVHICKCQSIETIPNMKTLKRTTKR